MLLTPQEVIRLLRTQEAQKIARSDSSQAISFLKINPENWPTIIQEILCNDVPSMQKSAYLDYTKCLLELDAIYSKAQMKENLGLAKLFFKLWQTRFCMILFTDHSQPAHLRDDSNLTGAIYDAIIQKIQRVIIVHQELRDEIFTALNNESLQPCPYIFKRIFLNSKYEIQEELFIAQQPLELLRNYPNIVKHYLSQSQILKLTFSSDDAITYFMNQYLNNAPSGTLNLIALTCALDSHKEISFEKQKELTIAIMNLDSTKPFLIPVAKALLHATAFITFKLEFADKTYMGLPIERGALNTYFSHIVSTLEDQLKFQPNTFFNDVIYFATNEDYKQLYNQILKNPHDSQNNFLGTLLLNYKTFVIENTDIINMPELSPEEKKTLKDALEEEKTLEIELTHTDEVITISELPPVSEFLAEFGINADSSKRSAKVSPPVPTEAWPENPQKTKSCTLL